jgi:FtsP/CotA-like multicopper oxidase with cupredoxin domain
MDKKLTQLIQRTMDVQRELTKEGLQRRRLMKLGVLGAGTGMLLPIKGLSLRAAFAGAACPIPGVEMISPPTRPFVHPLQRLHEMTPTYKVQSSVSELEDPTKLSMLRGGAPRSTPYHAEDSKLHLLHEHPELKTANPDPKGLLSHQAWDGTDRTGGLLNPPKDIYEMRAVQHKHIWHPDLPGAKAGGQTAWGFAPREYAGGVTGTAGSITGVPGPVFRLRYGRSHLVRIYNELPASAQDAVSALGFGTSTICTHMHNHHAPSESDGGPLYYNYASHFWDHHYPNFYAGINQWQANGAALQTADSKWNPSGVRGDFREALGSMWYHDHKHDFTSQNVYAGLFGACPIYDDVDTGDEMIAGTTGIRFPTHSQDKDSYPYEFDVPLMVHDRQFDPQGVDFFPLACLDGAIGDKMTVNGTIQPFMNVQPRRYRFRVYNGGPSRFHWWWLRAGENSTQFLPMTVIANDGNLLPNAVTLTNFKHAVGERFDIIIDFAALQRAGIKKVVLTNRAEQTNGRGPSGKLLAPAASMNVIKFVIEAARPGLTDSSTNIVNGTALRPLPVAVGYADSGKRNTAGAPILPVKLPTPTKTKEWVWGRSNGAWNANGVYYDRFAAPYAVTEGSEEVWVHKNGGGSWSHPIHPHYEEGRILSRKGTATPNPTGVIENSRKDVYRLDPSETITTAMRFRDYKGIYPMHCHNVVHEDHGMMAMWKIV